MFDATITIFNHYVSSTVNMWYPHVLKNTTITIDRGQIMRKYGAESKDNAELNISYSFDCDVPVIQDSHGRLLPFVSAKKWKSQVNDLLGETITFDSGDFFMLGEWPEDPVNNDDYQDRRYDGFYAYMNAEQDYVYLITSVGIYAGINHFEILGS